MANGSDPHLLHAVGPAAARRSCLARAISTCVKLALVIVLRGTASTSPEHASGVQSRTLPAKILEDRAIGAMIAMTMLGEVLQGRNHRLQLRNSPGERIDMR